MLNLLVHDDEAGVLCECCEGKPMPEDDELLAAVANYLDTAPDLAEKVARLNALRRRIAEHSPFRDEPVDLVEWVPADSVHANDYNPNSVAPPEMELLRLSIAADGYTQPIVTMAGDDTREVIDGFHRNRVGKECDDVRQRVQGYLPVVTIREDRTDKGDRIAATIRHNRARGKHQVIAMSDIVLDLKRRNWSDTKIAKELGMDADEVLRLAQITGLAEAFKDHEFSEAWEHTGPIEADTFTEDDVPVDLEWMNTVELTEHPSGWDDRTESSSVLYGETNNHLGLIQKSRFVEQEWFWYAYTRPMREGRAESRDGAKACVEQLFSPVES